MPAFWFPVLVRLGCISHPWVLVRLSGILSIVSWKVWVGCLSSAQQLKWDESTDSEGDQRFSNFPRLSFLTCTTSHLDGPRAPNSLPIQCFYISPAAMSLQGSIRIPRCYHTSARKETKTQRRKAGGGKEWASSDSYSHTLFWPLVLREGNHPGKLEAALLNTEIRASGTLPSLLCQKLDRFCLLEGKANVVFEA